MTRTVNALEIAATSPAVPTRPTAARSWSSLSDPGRATLLADRARRDAWLAQRLRDLTAEERDTLRRAAPLLERLANSD